MTRYEAGVEVEVKLTYHIVLQVDAETPEGAEDKLRWTALGMSWQELTRRVENARDPSQYYDGQERTVTGIGQIEEAEDEAGA